MPHYCAAITVPLLRRVTTAPVRSFYIYNLLSQWKGAKATVVGLEVYLFTLYGSAHLEHLCPNEVRLHQAPIRERGPGETWTGDTRVQGTRGSLSTP